MMARKKKEVKPIDWQEMYDDLFISYELLRTEHHAYQKAVEHTFEYMHEKYNGSGISPKTMSKMGMKILRFNVKK
jgi:hypothetical protein